MSVLYVVPLTEQWYRVDHETNTVTFSRDGQEVTERFTGFRTSFNMDDGYCMEFDVSNDVTLKTGEVKIRFV